MVLACGVYCWERDIADPGTTLGLGELNFPVVKTSSQLSIFGSSVSGVHI